MENIDNMLENNELEAENSIETLDETRSAETVEASETMETELSEADKVKAEAADWKDKYIRLYAEFENYRHRTSKEKLNLILTASENLMVDLLPVLDDFERTQKALTISTDVDILKEGVSLVYSKLLKTLTQKGLKPMESVGKPFDAELQEAITQFPAPNPEQKGQVIDEVEKGYTLNDKTIRFAKVVIGA